MTRRPRATHADRVLVAALGALALVYLAWFWPAPDRWIALAVFALPPALLAIAHARAFRAAAFWAGVLALAWFSHGVMAAWTRPAEAGYAAAEILLALAVIVSANWPGLRARFVRR